MARTLLSQADKICDPLQAGVVYRSLCGSCPKEYIGQTERALDSKVAQEGIGVRECHTVSSGRTRSK